MLSVHDGGRRLPNANPAEVIALLLNNYQMVLVWYEKNGTNPFRRTTPCLPAFRRTNGTIIEGGTIRMSVHDELLALCDEMHSIGLKLTYEAIRERRGGGSRRDISRALCSWHCQRANVLADSAFDRPDDVTIAGGTFAENLWSMISERLSERLREVVMEANLVEFHATQEIDHLHALLAEQLNEIDQLKAQVRQLKPGSAD